MGIIVLFYKCGNCDLELEELAQGHIATQGQGWLQNPASSLKGYLSFPGVSPWRRGLRQLSLSWISTGGKRQSGRKIQWKGWVAVGS